MKILIYSKGFYPDIGGAETNIELLSRYFKLFGSEVTLVTDSAGTNLDFENNPFPYTVLRKVTALEYFRLVKSHDIIFTNGVALRYLWPLIFIKKPWVCRHMNWLNKKTERNRIIFQLKIFATRYAYSIANSTPIANHLPVSPDRKRVILNPYRNTIFHSVQSNERTKDFVFLGRLVSDKGCQLLLEAFNAIIQSDYETTLTIIGDGPEKESLQNYVKSLHLEQYVTFKGELKGKELNESLNNHRILVVPSVWNEPFGVVALEGIASGCVIIGTSGGGLPEAIGPCGLIVPNGSVAALHHAMLFLIENPTAIQYFQSKKEAHLYHHRPESIAKLYFDTILQYAKLKTTKLH